MTQLNDRLDYVKVFLDDAGALEKDSFELHIEELDEVLTRIEDTGLQINVAKSKWAVKEVKCLGHIVTPNGCSFDPKKLQGLIDMKAPKSKCQVRKFLVGVNFCRKM